MLLGVVRRPFRSYGQYFLPGEVVEDLSKVKLVKVKVSDGKIILINTEHPKLEEQLANIGARMGNEVVDRIRMRLAVPIAPLNLPEPEVETPPVVEPPKARVVTSKTVTSKAAKE